MSAVEALNYLRDRMAIVSQAESRHRPHWTVDDIEAVFRLMERPAAAEQIALGRIEGIASQMNGFTTTPQAGQLVRNIARRALGMKAV